MKLLVYIHSLSSGGAERVTVTLANYWAQKGWEIIIVTVAERDRDFYNLNDNIRRIALDLAIESRHLAQAILNNLRRMWSLRRILLQEKPHVAISMMTTANVVLSISSLRSGIPSVGSERTYPPAMLLGRVWDFARRKTYPLLDCVVAQTAESATWLNKYAPAKSIAVIPNPVSFPMAAHPPNVNPAQVISELNGEKVILAVGRLGKEKRFERLMKAFSMLASRYRNWVLVIIGQGPLRDTLLQQAAGLGVVDKVALPGAVGNVGEWYEAADLYALTSQFEGFPNTLLEALAHGVPAVAVDCETGPRDIIRHKVDGLLVPQDDPDALITALDRMMGDAALRLQYAKQAVDVRERYSVEKIAGMWEDLFKKLIK